MYLNSKHMRMGQHGQRRRCCENRFRVLDACAIVAVVVIDAAMLNLGLQRKHAEAAMLLVVLMFVVTIALSSAGRKLVEILTFNPDYAGRFDAMRRGVVATNTAAILSLVVFIVSRQSGSIFAIEYLLFPGQCAFHAFLACSCAQILDFCTHAKDLARRERATKSQLASPKDLAGRDVL